MDKEATQAFINSAVDDNIIPNLMEFCRIPNQSPNYDPEFFTNGLITQVADFVMDWVNKQGIQGLTSEIVQREGAGPLMYVNIPASEGVTSGTILMYGHMDKQPPMEGWSEGLGPYSPVIRDDRMYARGGSDDGYSIFAGLTSIAACQKLGVPHSRIVFVMESEEESGSPNLINYMNDLSDKIGIPELVICLDSRARIYDRVWQNSSLRGVINLELTVKMLESPNHSGASGCVADSFRVIRMLLDRVEDAETGRLKVPELHLTLTPKIYQEAAKTIGIIGEESVPSNYKLAPGARLTTEDPVEQYLNTTFRPTLCITGCDGMPGIASAGNVLRCQTALKLNFRVPPGVDVNKGDEAIRKVLTENPPYGAQVTVEGDHNGAGFLAPVLAPWLEAALNESSKIYFDNDLAYTNGGGAIPFMNELKNRFPESQIYVCGVLGPGSNAHCPDESLDIPYFRKFLCALTHVVAKQANR